MGLGPISQGLSGWLFRVRTGLRCCSSSSQRTQARSGSEAGVRKKETNSELEIWSTELQK